MFIKKILLFLVILSLTWIAIVFGQAGNPTKMSQWIFDVYQQKKNLSQNIKGKKVLIVSGSSALFGIDSKMLSSYFKLPVLNYGVNAGIELPLTLHLAKRAINSGDIVLAPLAYPMYFYDSKVGQQMIDYIFAREPSFFWKVSLREQLYILSHIELERIIDGYNYQGGEPITTGVYGVHHIDDNGDQINTSSKFITSDMLDTISNHKKNPEIYAKEFSTDTLGWKYIEDFVTWCRTKDVQVIFTPSVQMRDESYFLNPMERGVYKEIPKEVKKRGWKYIGEPHDYMYDSSLYFNTNFHLRDKGRKLRTFQLIKLLISVESRLKVHQH